MSQQDKVKLCTAHSSKGLEFEVVFVLGMNNGHMPMMMATEPDNLEEEKRVAYVAMTRPASGLFLTYHLVRAHCLLLVHDPLHQQLLHCMSSSLYTALLHIAARLLVVTRLFPRTFD